jgi:hypothetical protein
MSSYRPNRLRGCRLLRPMESRGVADEMLSLGNRITFLVHIGVHAGKMTA